MYVRMCFDDSTLTVIYKRVGRVIIPKLTNEPTLLSPSPATCVRDRMHVWTVLSISPSAKDPFDMNRIFVDRRWLVSHDSYGDW